MLAPVPKKRSDGGSSFASLGKYLSEEIDVDTGEVTSRGEVMISPALLSADTAAAEMKAVAAENARCKDAVMHLVLSWKEGEQPTTEQWQDAVKHAMDSLKDREGVSMGDHQYMAVAHQDTENFHVHIMANRVHPETYRANSPEWLHKTLDKACREIEAEQGWQHSNGLYKWDEDKGKAVSMTREEREQMREETQERGLEQGMGGTGKASKMEAHGDAESLETYCKGQPAKDLSQLMKRDGINWQDVHSTMMKHGLELHKGEKGGYTVSGEGADGERIHVKASKVFRNQFAGKEQRAGTEEKLKQWEAPKEFLQHVAKKEQHYNEHREPRRNPQERMEKREERAKLREDLKDRYQEYKTAHYKERREKAPDHTEATRIRSELMQAKAQERATLREVGRLQRQQARPARQEKSLYADVRDIVRQELREHGPRINAERLARQAAREAVHQVKAIAKAIKYAGRDGKKAEDWTDKKIFKTPEFLKSAQEKKRDAAIERMEKYKQVQKAIKEEKDERRAVTRQLRGSLFERIAGVVEARAQRREDTELTQGERKAQLSVSVAESIKAGELVKEKATQLKAAQTEQKKQNQPQDYRTWVTDRVAEGDTAAISQIRGWQYQDGRNAGAIERRNAEIDQRDSAKPTDNERHDPADPRGFSAEKKSAALRMTWNVSKSGDVAYHIDGKKAFTDHGERVNFGNGKDDDAIELGLMLTARKYGGTVKLNGTDEFKQRAVEVAVKRGVDIQFADKELSIYQDAYKHQMQVEREREEARQRHEREQAQESSRDFDNDRGR